MSDEQKAVDLGYSCGWMYDEYKNQSSNDNLPEEVEDCTEEQLAVFGAYCLKHIDYSDTEMPAWCFMDYAGIVKNQWLIHLTNDAAGIASEGFKYGLEDFCQIAFTKFRKPKLVDDPNFAYCFAYTLGDFRRYGHDRGSYKYGDEAVVFRGSGVRISHNGDSEYQTIFMAGSARDIVPIYKTSNGDYWISGGFGNKSVFEAKDIETCADWVEANFDQYRKTLRREGKEK